MEYVFGSSLSLAQQATENVKLYRVNRSEQLKVLEYKIPKQIKRTILDQALQQGKTKVTFDISRDFNFADMLSLEDGKCFTPDSHEKEQIRKIIIDFLTEQDFNFDTSYSKITVRWHDPEHCEKED